MAPKTILPSVLITRENAAKLLKETYRELYGEPQSHASREEPDPGDGPVQRVFAQVVGSAEAGAESRTGDAMVVNHATLRGVARVGGADQRAAVAE